MENEKLRGISNYFVYVNNKYVDIFSQTVLRIIVL